MDSRLETRVSKLEAKRLAACRDVFDELSAGQIRALLILLEVERDGRNENCSPGELITDEMLWNNGMSSESHNAAISGIALEKFERIVAYVQAKESTKNGLR